MTLRSAAEWPTSISPFKSEKQRALMWDRWQQGETLHSIARLFDRGHSSIQKIIGERGGIRPTQRRRSRLALSLEEREEISRGLANNQSLRSIVSVLGRSPSTISRELHRNGGYDQYRAAKADQAAWDRAKRPKICKLAADKALARKVAIKLKAYWSPEQIAGWLKREHPDNEQLTVSHETIYRSLYIQTRGALKKELQAYLRTRRTMRRSKHFKTIR